MDICYNFYTHRHGHVYTIRIILRGKNLICTLPDLSWSIHDGEGIISCNDPIDWGIYPRVSCIILYRRVCCMAAHRMQICSLLFDCIFLLRRGTLDCWCFRNSSHNGRNDLFNVRRGTDKKTGRIHEFR